MPTFLEYIKLNDTSTRGSKKKEQGLFLNSFHVIGQTNKDKAIQLIKVIIFQTASNRKELQQT